MCIWGHYFANKRIRIHTDNKALVSILNSKYNDASSLVIQSMIDNFQMKASHIPGVENVLADK